MSLVNYIVAKLRPQPGGCGTKRAMQPSGKAAGGVVGRLSVLGD